MASINYGSKDISIKIVFIGQSGSEGKQNTLQYIHRKIRPENRSELVALHSPPDPTLFFDFIPDPPPQPIKGFIIKCQIYCCPMPVYYNATRKLVVRGVDAIVFVADCDKRKLEVNQENLQIMEDTMSEYGYRLDDQLSLVFQYDNKNSSEALSSEELDAVLNPRKCPAFRTDSERGDGIFDALNKSISLTREILAIKWGRGSNKNMTPMALKQTAYSRGSDGPANAPTPYAVPRPPLRTAPIEEPFSPQIKPSEKPFAISNPAAAAPANPTAFHFSSHDAPGKMLQQQSGFYILNHIQLYYNSAKIKT